MKTLCCVLLVVAMLLRFVGLTYADFNGRPQRRPGGFEGFIATVLVTGIHAAILYGAGVFDVIAEAILGAS